MKILMLMSLAVSANLTYAHHPVMIMILIIVQTLMICLMLWLMMPTAWFSFILFLIFIGGLMVLFIYITSLAANEAFNFNMVINNKYMLIIASLVLTGSLLYSFSLHSAPFISLNKQISLIFSSSLSFNTLIIMTYLLVTLIVVVKISTKIEGPIRNIFKQK